MSFTFPELLAIGGLTYLYYKHDNMTGDGERAKAQELNNRVIEKREGGQAPTTVINQKEFELIKRDVPLPSKPDIDPSLYDAKLDVALKDSEALAQSVQPMRPDRLVNMGTPAPRWAGKVMTDMLYFNYPREPLRGPDTYYADP